MAACAACGYETAVAFKFCPECGAAVRALDHEQRKVVTVLFCDAPNRSGPSGSEDPAPRAT